MRQAYWYRSIILGMVMRGTSRKGEKEKEEEKKKENKRHIVLDTGDGQL